MYAPVPSPPPPPARIRPEDDPNDDINDMSPLAQARRCAIKPMPKGLPSWDEPCANPGGEIMMAALAASTPPGMFRLGKSHEWEPRRICWSSPLPFFCLHVEADQPALGYPSTGTHLPVPSNTISIEALPASMCICLRHKRKLLVA